MVRRPVLNTVEHGPRWILTFNDIMTLLLTFFVLILSMSSLDVSAVRTIHQEMLTSLGGIKYQKDNQAGANGIATASEKWRIVAPTSGSPSKSAVLQDSEDLSLNAIAKALQDIFKIPLGDERFEETEKPDADGIVQKYQGVVDEHYYEPGVTLVRQQRGIVLRLPSTLLFKSGEVELGEKAYEILDAVAAVLACTDAHILIEGHTDSIPVANALYPSNWELSVARAAQVARYLIEKHSISPQRLGVSGYADCVPVVQNDTPQNRKLNRRVEIVFTRG